MNTNAYRLGIDIGSTTAKIVILFPDGTPAFSSYRRHNTETSLTLQAILREAYEKLGDQIVDFLITGSAGMGLAEKYDLPFIQETVAAAEVVHQRYPEVHTLIDIGGEDAKIIFFDEQARPDIRMNGSCAGGTGAFIDEMAMLIGVPVYRLDELASQSTQIYPMASRCGVFAKTDLQNLLSMQVPKEDIAASVFHAVALQVIATLARGKDILPQIMFSGGPFTFIPTLKRTFMKVLKLSEAQVAGLESPELLPALGAALAPSSKRKVISLQDLIAELAQEKVHAQSGENRRPPLFSSSQEFQSWKTVQEKNRILRIDISACSDGDYFLGIDSGSTTTKIVLTDDAGRVAFSFYASNGGNPIQVVQTGLQQLCAAFSEQGFLPRVARSVVTGYGEDLIRAAFGIDDGMVETLAHFRAAQEFDPRVTFILDIGGQDMKAIFIKDGQIQNIEINEACSSGCGSFLESFARNMGHSVADFAGLACQARSPYNLGTRCTVFMNSRVKQALREGASIEDISAGLAYSIIQNALHKVLKITNTDSLGEHIVVQGGTFRNPAIQKALELLLGRAVVCPDLAELMGAYGAALSARDAWLRQPNQPASLMVLTGLDAQQTSQKHNMRCKGCENQCAITRLNFANGRYFYTGNRCEKKFSNSGKHAYKGASMLDIKYRLLFDRPLEPETSPRAVIGIPRVLNLYENFPFWATLLVESGFRVQLSAPSRVGMYEKGAGTIMSENICFPAKLAHGHIYDLIEAGVDRIFYPMVTYENPEFADSDGVFNCPVVGGYPELIGSAIDPSGKHGIPLDKPAITMRDLGLFQKECEVYLAALGVDRKTARRAFSRAIAAQRKYKQAVRDEGARIIRTARAEGRPLVLMVGRPYHIDPQIHHKAPDILTDFGVDVLTEDSIPLEDNPRLENKHIVSLWQFSNRMLYAARWAGRQPDVEVVQINSFGCGPDAIAVDETRQTLREWQKGLSVIRVDEIESTGSMRLRLRSMVETLRRRAQARPHFIPRRANPVFQKADRQRTILVPDFSRFTTLPIVRPLQDMGYKMEILPPSNRESVEIGLKYTNNEICYPAIVVVGDVLKALQSGAYDPAQVAVGISQTGGQCRDSCYLSLLKTGLASAGFEQVPVISVATNFKPINEQPGVNVNYPEFIYKILQTVTYADSISAMYHACSVREVTPGSAWQLANSYMDALKDTALKIRPAEIQALLKRAVQSFNGLPAREGDYPAVGVVGEIYVKLNPFGGGGVVPWLTQQGVEVILPPLTEYFTSNFVNWSVDLKQHLARPDWVWALSQLVEHPMEGYIHRIDEIMEDFRFYRPAQSIWQMAERASKVLGLTNHYGEGWLIPGGIARLVESGVKNILCLQPFGCIANHVVAKGVQNRLKSLYPEMNLLFLDCDAGSSEVNFYNRMHFFLHHTRKVYSQ